MPSRYRNKLRLEWHRYAPELNKVHLRPLERDGQRLKQCLIMSQETGKQALIPFLNSKELHNKLHYYANLITKDSMIIDIITFNYKGDN